MPSSAMNGRFHAIKAFAALALAAPTTLLAGPDFNGDGPDDLAIGVPFESIGGHTQAGAVEVMYGALGGGITLADDRLWHEGSSGIAPRGGADDNMWGTAMAWGDFDKDGFDDLAIGVPGETVAGQARAGAVYVLYGTDLGLRAQQRQRWTAASNSILGDPTADAVFGASLAVGDFNGDEFDDLAIGEPGADVNGIDKAGAVHVLYGSFGRLRAAGNQLWSQDSPGILETAEADDQFAAALVTGDFDGDGFEDLAIGVPFEDLGAIADSGAVQILYGRASGLRSQRNQVWTQDSPGIANTAEADDRFGLVLATGDFDDDDRDDLAIGIPFEDIGSNADAGAVQVIYGSQDGLIPDSAQWWNQNTADIRDVANAGDRFGSALAVGDFDRNGHADLAIGVPFEDVKNDDDEVIVDAGLVHVIYSKANGLKANGNQVWSQKSEGIVNTVQTNDHFGAALSAGDYDGDSVDDLVIGVPDENVNGRADAGAVHVIYGTFAGLSNAGDQFFHQDSENTAAKEDVADQTENGDRFGVSLPGSPVGVAP
jgi:hypothetical protein